jgi:hypothetical protein
MSTPLHLNLLKDEERFSPNPVRLRVMLPMLSVLAALGCLIWWALLGLRAHSQTTTQERLTKTLQDMRTSHATVLDLHAQQREAQSIIQQLQLYARSCLRFGDTLGRLPSHVPMNIQFTEMRIPPPPAPLVDLKTPTLGPTNACEGVTLRIAGRISGENAYTAVNALLATLRTPAFSNLVQTADIPKGAFRQEAGRSQENRDTLLFEILCGCVPRRFE